MCASAVPSASGTRHWGELSLVPVTLSVEVPSLVVGEEEVPSVAVPLEVWLPPHPVKRHRQREYAISRRVKVRFSFIVIIWEKATGGTLVHSL